MIVQTPSDSKYPFQGRALRLCDSSNVLRFIRPLLHTSHPGHHKLSRHRMLHGPKEEHEWRLGGSFSGSW